MHLLYKILSICIISAICACKVFANDVFGFVPLYVNYNNESGFDGENFIPKAQSDKIIWEK